MNYANIAEAKINLSRYISMLEIENIVIKEDEKPVAVLVDYNEFMRLKSLDKDKKLDYKKHLKKKTPLEQTLDMIGIDESTSSFDDIDDSIDYAKSIRKRAW